MSDFETSSMFDEGSMEEPKKPRNSHLKVFKELIDPITGEVHPEVELNPNTPDAHFRKQLERKMAMTLEEASRYNHHVDYKFGLYLFTVQGDFDKEKFRDAIANSHGSFDISKKLYVCNLYQNGGFVQSAIPLGLYMSRKGLTNFNTSTREMSVCMHVDSNNLYFYAEEMEVNSNLFAKHVAPIIAPLNKHLKFKYFAVDNKYYDLDGKPSFD